jgi:flagellar basal-body rod modification protein FlgD
MDAIATLERSSTSGGAARTSSQSDGLSALTSDDFLKIIFTELGKQDPLQPNDTNALLQQLSTVRSIQSDVDLSTRLGSLVNQSEFSAASTLIGRSVSGLSEENARVAGVVASVSRTSNGAVLKLEDGTRVPMTGLDEVQARRESETGVNGARAVAKVDGGADGGAESAGAAGDAASRDLLALLREIAEGGA